ncbi:MAG: adenylate/guanylate cyclase domain-containing protein [Candidatus Eremiobacteraeota bacterium]|nr:adenylate/guanylate cyclase domain-containing protein [Candidatus Eremiobacteraeota bacterium]
MNDAVAFANDKGIFAQLHVPAVDFEAPNDALVLIKIDEESIGNTAAGLTAFPFPRSVYGRLLSNLHKAGAKVAAFDIDFPEPSADPSQDAAFAAGMRQMPTVLPYTISTTSQGILGREALDPRLSPLAVRQGFTTVDNPGGILLGQPLEIAAGTQRLQSFAAATAEAFTGQTVSRIDTQHARFGNRTIPLDDRGVLLLLPFTEQARQDITIRRGAETTTIPFAQTVSFADAYRMSVSDLKTLAGGKAVVIGSTAQALGDFVLTPFGRIPGVYANLRLIDQLLSGKLVTTVPRALNIALILLLPFLLAFLVTQFNATRGILLCLIAVVLYGVFAIVFYATKLVWVDMLHVAMAMLLATLFIAIYRTIAEGSERRMIRNLFGAHVSPAVVDDLLRSDDPRHALALEGKRVKATIFYSDIRGFTAISEHLAPDEIYTQLNEYFEEMCAIIFKYGGYVDKFIGDCVMSVFSAPNQQPDDARRAVRAAVEQQTRIKEIGDRWASRGQPVFTVGMGLNTGEVIMGNLGSSSRLNYTVIGDSVNTASRLYSVALGGQIIISESTYDEVKDTVEAVELEPVSVKGKSLPLRIFNVTRMRDGAVDR